MRFYFFLDGVPVPKGRPRMTRSGHTYTPKKTGDYERYIRLKSMQHRPPNMPLGPILMNLDFVLPRPKSLSQKIIHHIKRPDIDNFIKTILDGLNGYFYKDDSQVISLTTTKRYGESVGVHVFIQEISVDSALELITTGTRN